MSHLPSSLTEMARLASAHAREYATSGNVTALDRAITIWDSVLQSPDFPVLASDRQGAYLNEGGAAYLRRYRVNGTPTDLEQALVFWQKALDVTLPTSLQYPTYLNNLGGGFSTRYAWSGLLEDIEHAIQLYKAAVETTPLSSPHLGAYTNNWATGLSARFYLKGDMRDLEQSILAFQDALKHIPLTDPHRPSYLNNLGNALSSRYTYRGDVEDVTLAISCFAEAIALIPDIAPTRPTYLSNLGNALTTRFSRTGVLDDVAEAIAAFREAVSLTPLSSPQRAIRLNNLGTGWRTRFTRTRESVDLEKAIAAFQEAVLLTPATSPHRATFLMNVGNGYRARFAVTQFVGDLERAIAFLRESVEAVPLSSPARAAHLANLGNGYRAYYGATAIPIYLEQAIDCYQTAVDATESTSPDFPLRLNNLANGLRSKFGHTANNADKEKAIACYRSACQWGVEVTPEEVMRSGRTWGNWALTRGDWEEASEAYKYSLAALDYLYQSQGLLADRESWLRELAEQPQNAAYALARQGRLEEAVVVLEQGRTRLWRSSMERDLADLRELALDAPDLVQAYQSAATHLRELESQERRHGHKDLRHSIRNARATLDLTITAIRGVTGYKTFLQPPDIQAILEATQSRTPLAYLVVTVKGSLILVVLPVRSGDAPSIVDIWSAELTLSIIADWVKRSRNKTGLGRLRFNKLLSLFGTALIAPLRATLQLNQARDVILVPVGQLAAFPLHAIVDVGNAQCLLDEFNVVFAPAATMVRSLRRGTKVVAATTRFMGIGNPLPDRAVGITAHYELMQLLLLLAAHRDQLSASTLFTQLWSLGDGTPEALLQAGMLFHDAFLQLASLSEEIGRRLSALTMLIPAPLPYARMEVESIVPLLPSQNVTVSFEQAATATVFWNALPRSTIVHFACHGYFDESIPLNSSLLLAAGTRITLRELITSEPTHFTRLELVVLSACETAAADHQQLPDEVFGLPVGFLHAGVPTVIGSLWAVDDLSTAILMVRFYELYLSASDTELSAATALRLAQGWLRDVTYAGLNCFVRHHPMLSQVNETITNSVPWGRPFADPYFWAGFICIGVPAGEPEVFDSKRGEPMVEIVEDLMIFAANLLVLPYTVLVQDIIASSQPGQIILLQKEQHPYAILTEELVQRMEPTQPVLDYEAWFNVPTITKPKTSLLRIVLGMSIKPSVRWHVVMDGERLLGVLPPVALTHLFLHKTTAQMRSGSESRQFLEEEVKPNSLASPFSLCFHCPNDSSHHFWLAEVLEFVTIDGRVRCPYDGNILLQHNACPDQED